MNRTIKSQLEQFRVIAHDDYETDSTELARTSGHGSVMTDFHSQSLWLGIFRVVDLVSTPRSVGWAI